MQNTIFTPSQIRQFITTKEISILIAGLPLSGKSTLLKTIGLDEPITQTPDPTFSLETVVYGHVGFQIFTKHFKTATSTEVAHLINQTTSGIIYLIDANNINDVMWAKTDLRNLLSDKVLANVPVLILANKCDLPNCMPIDQVEKQIEQSKITNTRKILPCSIISGIGLSEGFDWFIPELKKTIEN